ncbi:MAG: DUF2171 domain-containing protein [Novosphingobium sp.]|nr:DUF2171 domain-containing protein [Novosphingobium sp.]
MSADPAIANPRSAPGQRQKKFRTFAGTIARGMVVLDANDRIIGEVDRVESDHIILVSGPGSPDYFVPLSLIDGISGSKVLLSGRGDAAFGLGATP